MEQTSYNISIHSLQIVLMQPNKEDLGSMPKLLKMI